MQEPSHREEQPNLEVLSLLDIAIRGYQHAEAVVQSRLYNFLFADSILLLSWASVYSGGTSSSKWLVLASLALLSAVLGICWSVLGLRHRKFLFVLTQVIDDIEKRLPLEWRVAERITMLQEGGKVKARGHDYELNWLEKSAKSRNLGVVAPLVMAAASLFLLCISLRLHP